MKIIDPISEEDLKFWMSGPLESYDVKISASFSDSKTLIIIVTTTTPFTGDDTEYLHLKFSSTFVSKNGAKLVEDESKANTKEVLIAPDVIAALGTTVNSAMATTIVTIIASNVAMGQS